jgi:hypothetical protein
MSVKSLSVILLAIVGLTLIISPCTAGLHVQTSTNIALAKGDPLTITGTGFVNGSAVIWGIGPSFFTYQVVPAAPDGNVEWTLGREVTRTLRSGPLMIFVQDPGQDRQYSLRVAVSEGKNRVVLGNGTDLFKVEPNSRDIPATMDLAEQMKYEISKRETDDASTLLTIFVEEPSIHFQQENPDAFQTVVEGERIRFSGTMNLAPENRVTVRIEDTSVIEKTGSRIPVRTGAVTVVRTGELQNTWEYTLETSGLNPGEYLVEVGWDQSAVSGQAATIFRVTPQPDMASSVLLTGSDKTTGGASHSSLHLSVPAYLLLLPDKIL